MRLDEALKLSDKVRRKSLSNHTDNIVDKNTQEALFFGDAIADDWEPVIEKKNVMVYPALYTSNYSPKYGISIALFENDAEASKYCKDVCGIEFIKLLKDRGVEVEV